MYVYHVTECGGEKVWRAAKYDFANTALPHAICAQFSAKNIDGGTIRYTARGYFVGTRLVLIQTNEIGDEPPTVQVFPNASSGFGGAAAGFSVLQTYDDRRLIGPVLLSDKPLLDIEDDDDKLLEPSDQDTVPDTEGRSFEALQRLWFECIKNEGWHSSVANEAWHSNTAR